MTPENKELLELAAKAIHLKGKYYEYEDSFGMLWGFQPEGAKTGRDHWNPLISNDDAFKLMIQLKMVVDCVDSICVVSYNRVPDRLGPVDDVMEEYGKNSEYSVRLAIVKAAAEIGKKI